MTDQSLTRTLQRPDYRRLLPLAAAAGLLVAAFWWTGSWMVTRWETANSYYSHGWLVPPVAAFLLWRKRREFAAAPIRPCAWGLLLLVPSLLAHLLGTMWQVGFISGFALLGVLGGLVLTFGGRAVFRIALFPLVFLAFMVPVPVLLVELFSFRLKMVAARIAVRAADLFGMAAIREGSYIRIPSGTVVVDDVCSGLKYLISLTAFGALYAHISSVKGWQKATLFLMAIPVAFAANVVRVILMVTAAYFWGVEATEAWYFHDLFGFLLFVVAFLMLFGVESLFLRNLDLSRVTGGAAAGSDEATTDHGHDPPVRRYSPVLSVGALAVLAVTAGLSVHLSLPRQVKSATTVLQKVPQTFGEWSSREIELSERTYEILGTKDVLSRIYTNDAGEEVVMVIVLAQQTRKRTHPPEQCMTGEGFVIESTHDRPVTIPSGSGRRTFNVRELILQRGSLNRVAWYWYKSGERLETSYWKHQAGVALRKFADPTAPDVQVRIDTTVRHERTEEAQETLKQFLDTAGAPLLENLP